jgi:hypothetical protein
MTGMQQPAHREAVEPAMSREGVHSRRVVAGSMARSSAQAMDCIWGISSRPPTNANFRTASRRYTGYRRKEMARQQCCVLAVHFQRRAGAVPIYAE